MLSLLVLSTLCAVGSTRADQWASLNSSVGGRLKSALPVSAPCFSTVNGHHASVNSTACNEVIAGYTLPDFRSPRYGAFMLPHWETCQKTSEQCLLDTSNPSNPAAWTNYTCQQGSVSPFYLDVQHPSDVSLAFAFAKAFGVPLSIKNSGHDYKGRSSQRNSLALWTRNLKSLSYNAAFVPVGGSQSYQAITTGAGVSFQELYQFADQNGVTAIGGYHQTIAAGGGWLQGGGHSILSNVYGLGIDRALQFKIVTPDGVYRTANAYTNSDLFWALRGGGGGTFGVVLEATVRVEPQVTLQVVSIKFPQTATNSPPFLKLVVDNALKWGQEGWGGHIGAANIINVNPLLTLDEAKASVQDVVDYSLAQNGTAVVEQLPSWYAFYSKYVLGAQSAVGTENILGTWLIPGGNFSTDAGKEAIYDAIVDFLPHANPYIVLGTPFLYNYTANSTSATPAWRGALWHLGFHLTFGYNSTVAQKAATYQLGTQMTQSLRDIAPKSGAYTNEGDVYEPNPSQAFWGANYPALLAIKKKYDPHGLLNCWHCVGWKGASDPLYSCYI